MYPVLVFYVVYGVFWLVFSFGQRLIRKENRFPVMRMLLFVLCVHTYPYTNMLVHLCLANLLIGFTYIYTHAKNIARRYVSNKSCASSLIDFKSNLIFICIFSWRFDSVHRACVYDVLISTFMNCWYRKINVEKYSKFLVYVRCCFKKKKKTIGIRRSLSFVVKR